MPDSTATYSFGADSIPYTVPTAMPADSAFVHSSLELPHSAVSAPSSCEEGRPVFIDITVAVFVIFFILNTKKIINILPYLFGCMLRWKESVNLEYSMKTSRSRDDVALLSFIPFCLVASKYSFLPYLNNADVGEMWKFLITTGTAIAYILLRLLANMLGRTGRCPSKTYETATKTSRTFLCIVTVFTLATAGIMSLTPADAQVTRTVLLCETAFVYLIFIIRKSQIFKNSCSLFSTILYLCTLEILPTGILVAAAIYLQ